MSTRTDKGPVGVTFLTSLANAVPMSAEVASLSKFRVQRGPVAGRAIVKLDVGPQCDGPGRVVVVGRDRLRQVWHDPARRGDRHEGIEHRQAVHEPVLVPLGARRVEALLLGVGSVDQVAAPLGPSRRNAVATGAVGPARSHDRCRIRLCEERSLGRAGQGAGGGGRHSGCEKRSPSDPLCHALPPSALACPVPPPGATLAETNRLIGHIARPAAATVSYRTGRLEPADRLVIVPRPTAPVKGAPFGGVAAPALGLGALPGPVGPPGDSIG